MLSSPSPPSSLAGPSVASVYISMQSRYHIDISADIALIPHERFFSGPICPFFILFFYFAAGTTGRPISFALNGQVTSSASLPLYFFARLFSGRINYAWCSLPKCCHPRAWCPFGVHIQSGLVNSRQSVIVIVVALANGP